MDPLHDPDSIAATRAEKHTDVQIDFWLEDIIAGNAPDGETGRQLAAIVDRTQDLPTQGKVEAALIPLYEALAADFYRQEGGAANPPIANRHSIRQHAVKVMQARKIRRSALARAVNARSQPRTSNLDIRLPLIIIAVLLIVIAAVML